MVKHPHFFLVSMFCSIPLQSLELGELSIIKYRAIACVISWPLITIGSNWGELGGFSLCYQFGTRLAERPIVDKILPKPLRLAKEQSYFYCNGQIIGSFSGILIGGVASAITSEIYACLPNRYLIKMGIGAIALLVAHSITYSLAKRALQWHIDRSYYRGLTRGA